MGTRLFLWWACLGLWVSLGDFCRWNDSYMVSGTWLAPFFLELEKECWGTGSVSRMSNLSKRNLEAKRGCKFASVLGIRRFQVRKRLFQLPPGVLALGHSCVPQCTWSWSHTKTAGAVLQPATTIANTSTCFFKIGWLNLVAYHQPD